MHVFEQRSREKLFNLLHHLSPCSIFWLLKRGYLGYLFPFYQLEQSGNSALTFDMFFQRSEYFPLFNNILSKHQRRLCRKISPTHLALILLFFPSSEARVELWPFDKYFFVFAVVQWCTGKTIQAYPVYLLHTEILMTCQPFLQALQLGGGIYRASNNPVRYFLC